MYEDRDYLHALLTLQKLLNKNEIEQAKECLRNQINIIRIQMQTKK